MIINQWELKLETGNLLKAQEMRVTKSWLVLISHLIANCDTSFLDQSQWSMAKQKQSSSTSILSWKLL